MKRVGKGIIGNPPVEKIISVRDVSAQIRDNREEEMNKDESIINVENKEDPITCIPPVKEEFAYVERKTLDEKLIDAVSSKYHGRWKSSKKLRPNKLTTYKTTIKRVAAMLVMGVGGEEMENQLAFLDLPHGKSFSNSSLPVVEHEPGEFLRETAKAQMEATLEGEVRLTLEEQ
eukprot:3705354-Ditylum_brightwellii.AAC.1